MKKNIAYISLFIFMLCIAACNSDAPPEKLVDEDGNAMLMEPATTKTGKSIPSGAIDVSDLKGKKGHNGVRIYLDKNKNPYNGIAIQHSKDENSDAHIEYTIAQGKMTRLRGYYGPGALERDFTFKDGISHGKFVMWYENGEKYIEENYVEGNLHGEALRWYENGNKLREAEFKNGKLVSETLYKQDGTIKR